MQLVAVVVILTSVLKANHPSCEENTVIADCEGKRPFDFEG